MLRSNSPSVLGLVSMRQATSSPALARRSSRSTPPSAFVPTLTTSKPAMVTVAGLGAGGRVGGEAFRPPLAVVLVVGAREQHAGELAVRSRRRLERHVRQAG